MLVSRFVVNAECFDDSHWLLLQMYGNVDESFDTQVALVTSLLTFFACRGQGGDMVAMVKYCDFICHTSLQVAGSHHASRQDSLFVAPFMKIDFVLTSQQTQLAAAATTSQLHGLIHVSCSCISAAARNVLVSQCKHAHIAVRLSAYHSIDASHSCAGRM